MGSLPSKAKSSVVISRRKTKRKLKEEEEQLKTALKRTESGRLVFEEEFKNLDDIEAFTTAISVELTRDLGKGKLGLTSKKKMSKKLAKLESGHLYQDTHFPPTVKSLYFSNDRNVQQYRWLSPRQLSDYPQLLVHGVSRDDIMQGALGDCWFLSSCAVIAQSKELMQRVIPDQQPLYGEDYKGVVKFRFWRYGEWVEVYVDDLLPTVDGKLIYARCGDPNEFWVSLLEKAYAKLHGCYEALEGGQSMDGLVDLTGGIAERHEMRDYKNRSDDQLFQKVKKACNKKGTFITCSKEGSYKGNVPTMSTTGLIGGHAYSCTGAVTVKYKGKPEYLVRVRNPWGMGQEWTGAWADNDSRWDSIDQESKNQINFHGKEDGEWWMSFHDFRENFQETTICTLGPDFQTGSETVKTTMIHGEWVLGESAGGCRNDIKGYATNPQYLMTINEKDDDEDETCNVVLGLMQEHRRSKRGVGVKMLQIAFLIYETQNTNKRLDERFLERNREVVRSGPYVNFREVVGRFELKPGNYIVIPTTYDRNEPGKFLIRLYSLKPVSLKLLDQTSNGREYSNRKY